MNKHLYTILTVKELSNRALGLPKHRRIPNLKEALFLLGASSKQAIGSQRFLLFFLLPFLLGLGVASTLTAQITPGAAAYGTFNNSSSATISYTNASGTNKLLMVGVAAQQPNASVTSITFNGTALTKLGNISNSSQSRIEIWYLKSPSVGTYNVVVNNSQSDNGVIGVMAFSGVHQTTTFGTLATAQGASTTASVAASSAAGELVYGVACFNNWDSDLTPGSGQTEYWDQTVNSSATGAGSTKAGAASVTMSWTSTSSNWTIGAVSLKPAPTYSPGGVTGAAIWLKADKGVTTGATLTWADQSGNNRNAIQSTAANKPTVSTSNVNFNPSFVFDGTNDYLTLQNLTGLPTGASQVQQFAVGVLLDYSGNNARFLSYGTAGVPGQLFFLGKSWNNAMSSVYATDAFSSAQEYAGGKATLVEGKYTGTQIVVSSFGVQKAAVAASSNRTIAAGSIGASETGTGDLWNGYIPEIILFPTNLSAANVLRVNSYLSLKYGITLDQTTAQNYMASDGTTVFWNGTTNSGYKNNIAGIVRDDGSELNQKQSKSANAALQVVMGNGNTIAADNASNTNNFSADKSALVWGDNAGSVAAWSATGAPFVRQILARTWKLQETGTVGSVKVQIADNGATNGLPAEVTTVYLLVDADGDFSSGATETTMTLNGTNWEADVDFASGQYFTFATETGGGGGGGGTDSIAFTQITPMCTDLVMPAGGVVQVKTYVSGASGGSSTTVSKRISLNTDDAEEEGPESVYQGPGQMYHGSSDLELVSDTESPSVGTQKVGLRFTNLTIPQGASIVSAKLTFRAIAPDGPNTNNGATNLTIKCQSADNPSTFGTGIYDITNRPTTSSSASWSPAAWTTGLDYDSPDLASVVQEIVNRSGWNSGNAMVFIITGSGSRSAHSYEGSTTLCPLLTIEYSTSTPIPANPNVSAVLKHGSTTFATLTNPVYDSGAGTLTWSQVLGSNYTLPAGEAVSLEITKNDTGYSFDLQYDSQTKPSKIDLPTQTIIEVEELAVYDTAYANGSVIEGAENGETVFIRTTVSDPFGPEDVTSLDLTITSPSNLVLVNTTLTEANVVGTVGCNKIYEYAWTTGVEQGDYNIGVVAHEGYENIIDEAITSIKIQYDDFGTPCSVQFTDGTTGVTNYDPNSQVCVQVIDIDENENPASVETITATVSSASGDDELLTLTETGVNTGIFTACIVSSSSVVGSDNNGSLYAPMSSLLTLRYSDPDLAADECSATAVINSLTPDVDIAIQLIDPADGVATVGEFIRFDITVSNPGTTDLTSLTLTNTFNASQLTFTGASLTPSVTAAGSLTWNINVTIPAGESFTIETWFTGASPANTAVSTASVSGVDENSVAVSAGPVNDDVLITDPEISINKFLTDPPAGPYLVGDTLTFQIDITNTGNTNLATLPLSDDFSATCLRFVSAVPAPDGSGAGSLVWNNLGALATGATTSVTTRFVIVGACSPVENHAAVTLAVDVNGDPVPDVEDTESVTTIAPPIAVDDVDTTGIATPVVTPVLQNDSDPNGNIKVNTIKTTGVLQPSFGAAVANTTSGNITYIPQAGFTGVDTYEYIICDSTNLCDTALVTIYIFNEDCSNGIDDDGDGLVDCADPDCSNFTNGGTIAGDQALCAIYDPAQITSVSPPSGGIGGVVEYKWQSSTDGGLNWNDISGATAETYDPPVISQTTSYRRAARRFACGNWVYSNTVIKSNTNCPEICDNGRDDDGDGLIDCLDSDCSVALLASNDVSVCPGSSAALTASASGGVQPYHFIWDNNLGEGANQTASPATTTTYRVLVETASGCIAVDSVVVTVSAPPTANAGADVSICTGGSATLTASASGGSGGGYAYSWSGGLGSGANKTVSPASTTTYTVTVTDGNGCSGTDAVVVTVVADPAISAQPSGFTECVGGVQALSVTATGGTPSLTYQWQSSADNVTFSNIAGATIANYAPPSSVAGTTYFRCVVSASGNGCGTVTSSSVPVVIVADPAISGQPTGGTICSGSTFILSLTATGGTPSLSYQWQSSPDNSTWSNIAGATASNFTTPALASTTYFRCVVSASGNGCGNATSNSATVTVTTNFSDGGTIGFDETNCSSYDPSLITSVTLPSGGSGGSVQYQWERRQTDGAGGWLAWADIAGATAATYDPAAIAVSWQFRRKARLSPCLAWIASNIVSKNLYSDLGSAGTIGGNESNCGAFDPALITSISDASGSGSIQYKWEQRTESGSWQTIPGASGNTYDPPAITETMYYRRLAKVSVCPGWYPGNEVVKTVVVNFTDGGTLAGNEVSCLASFNPAAITEASPPAGGAGGTIEYQWEFRESDGTGGWLGWQTIVGATGSSYDPGFIFVNTQYRRSARRSNCTAWQVSNTIEKTVGGSATATPDAFTTCPGIPFSDYVFFNDVSPASPVYTIFSPPTSGSVSINNFGKFTYVPFGTACSTDVFAYRVCNASGTCCDTALVQLTIGDTLAPILQNVPADLTIECDEEIPLPPLIYAFDSCPAISMTFDETSTEAEAGACANFTITRTWEARDLCGNSTLGSQVITVQDSTPPSIFRVYTLPNGKRIFGGILEKVSDRWKSVYFPVGFAAPPVVLAQVISANEASAVAVRLRNVNGAGFEIRLQEQEASSTSHAYEQVAWFATEQGVSPSGAGGGGGDFDMEAFLASGATHNWQTLNFSQTYAGAQGFLALPQTTNEVDPVSVRIQNLVGNSVQARLQEETSKASETNHAAETLGCLAFDANASLADEQGIVFAETGSLSGNDQWQTVHLQRNYNTPVIVLGGVSFADGEPLTVRVRNVGSDSFEFRIEEWDYQNGSHAAENLTYFVMEGSLPKLTVISNQSEEDALTIGFNLFGWDNCGTSVPLLLDVTTESQGATLIYQDTYSTTDACGNSLQIVHQRSSIGVSVRVKALLNGAVLNSTGGLMRDDLRQLTLIPLKEPYSQIPGFGHKGMGGDETTTPEMFAVTGNSAIVDWVLVELFDPAEDTLIATVAALLQRDGRVVSASGDSVIVVGGLNAGFYKVAIKHRNHLGLLTGDEYFLSEDDPPLIDFSSNEVPVAGDVNAFNMVNGKRVMWAGDFNSDGKVIYQGPANDVFSLFLKVVADPLNYDFLANYISTGYLREDFNLNGKVIYQGPNNDRALVLFKSTLAHPLNQGNFANFVIYSYLP